MFIYQLYSYDYDTQKGIIYQRAMSLLFTAPFGSEQNILLLCRVMMLRRVHYLDRKIQVHMGLYNHTPFLLLYKTNNVPTILLPPQGHIFLLYIRSDMEQLDNLRGCEVHSSVILSQVDEKVFKRLGVNLTCEPRFKG